MKYFFALLAVLYFSETFSQQEGASENFVHLSRVQKPPFSPDCTMDLPICTANLIEDFILENITSLGTVTDGVSEKTELQVKVIINTSGQISWASVKGLPAETSKKLALRLKQMPAFLPGEHDGQKTNVIVDLIMPLLVWEAENFSYEARDPVKANSGAVWLSCRKAEDKKTCTHHAVNNWMNRKISSTKIKKPGFYALTANFAIGAKGAVGRVVVHGGGEELGPEVMKQIKKLPSFEPAKMGEEPVATYYILPITMRRFDY